MDAPDLLRLPEGLPVPVDDGAASHLPGRAMPALSLPATDGRQVALDALGSGRTVVYIYPMTGRPGVELPEGWDDIPGARGCTPESCGFRNLYAELQAAGAAQVFGLSSQPTEYQAEAVDRLHLPFAMLSDEHLALVDALGLPTFTVERDDALPPAHHDHHGWDHRARLLPDLPAQPACARGAGLAACPPAAVARCPGRPLQLAQAAADEGPLGRRRLELERCPVSGCGVRGAAQPP